VKINAQQIVGVATGSGSSISAVLLFGPDQGLISETARRLIAAIAGQPVDPFLLTELTPGQLKADPTLLIDEMLSLPLMGERKVIHLRQATDALAGPLADLMGAPKISNLLVVEAGELAPRSKLRKAFEAAKSGGAVGCYSDDRGSLEGVLRDVLASHDIAIEADAAAELLGRLGNDRLISRGEIEKLALYVGDGGRITADAILQMITDNAALSIDSVVFDAADGNTPGSDQALARALADGISAVQILRTLQRHFQRLHLVAGEVAQGARLDAALGRLRPPVFFKFKSRFQRQCGQWSLDRLADAMTLVSDAERQCKQTGAPAAAICQRAVLRIAAAARKQRPR